MIRRLFVYLSVSLILLCFITSCKKDSPAKDIEIKHDEASSNVSQKKKVNLVIRDDKTNTDELVTENEINGVTETSDSNDEIAEQSQEEQSEHDTRVYDVAESLPEFPGGVDALHKYLNEKTSSIPELSHIHKTLRTMISLIVETDGSLSSLNIAKSSGNKNLDDEALQIVLHMPAWEPGKNNGENVRMKYLVPVIFNPAQ